jgi:hypothetical protein
MGFSDELTQRLAVDRTVRQPLNGSRSGLYGSRTADAAGSRTRNLRPTGSDRVRRLRELARTGRLADTVASAEGAELRMLRSAAYDVVWPIVFSRLTYRVEQRRGHLRCMGGVDQLADECLDGFHDDVEAVVEDLLSHARQPVHHLEAWIAGRVNAATVDAYRRRRGERGALQRPRLPAWLAAELGHDSWLTTLAVQILVWVGVKQTAGTEVWPVDSWAQDRGRHTGNWRGSEPGVVAREIDMVLAAMRRRPAWFESFVERPLGSKQAPVAVVPVGGTDQVAAPLDLSDPFAQLESEMLRLAAAAVDAISNRRGNGEDTQAIVVEVVQRVFGTPLTALLDRAPHEVTDPVSEVTGALADPATVDRIVATVRSFVRETP